MVHLIFHDKKILILLKNKFKLKHSKNLNLMYFIRIFQPIDFNL